MTIQKTNILFFIQTNKVKQQIVAADSKCFILLTKIMSLKNLVNHFKYTSLCLLTGLTLCLYARWSAWRARKTNIIVSNCTNLKRNSNKYCINLIMSSTWANQLQWGSENRTCPVFECSTLAGFRMVSGFGMVN